MELAASCGYSCSRGKASSAQRLSDKTNTDNSSHTAKRSANLTCRNSKISALCYPAQASILPEGASIGKIGCPPPLWRRLSTSPDWLCMDLGQLLGQKLGIGGGTLTGEAHTDIGRGSTAQGRAIKQQRDGRRPIGRAERHDVMRPIAGADHLKQGCYVARLF